jgi:hypothetical protein
LVAGRSHKAEHGVAGALALRVSHKQPAAGLDEAARRAAASGAVGFRPKAVGQRPRGRVVDAPPDESPAAASAARSNPPDVAKRARARWGKVRTALMAKSLFCSKASASDVYDTATVTSAASGSGGQMSTDAAAELARILADCKRAGKKYTDPAFPPNDRSLYRDPNKPGGGGGSSCTGWKRLGELSDKPQLFKDGVEAGDVIQGQLGDCWFLGALSVVAERDKLFFGLFNSTETNAYGVYSCRFFHNGAWEDVIMLPVPPARHRLRPARNASAPAGVSADGASPDSGARPAHAECGTARPATGRSPCGHRTG